MVCSLLFAACDANVPRSSLALIVSFLEWYMVFLGSYANEGCDYESYLIFFACSRRVL